MRQRHLQVIWQPLGCLHKSIQQSCPHMHMQVQTRLSRLAVLSTFCGLQGTPTLEQLKLKYYELMITYHANQNDHLEICRCFRAMYETPCIADDESKRLAVLKKICWFSVLAAASSDQVCSQISSAFICINVPFRKGPIPSMYSPTRTLSCIAPTLAANPAVLH